MPASTHRAICQAIFPNLKPVALVRRSVDLLQKPYPYLGIESYDALFKEEARYGR